MQPQPAVGLMDYLPEKNLNQWNDQWTNYDNVPFYEEAASGLLQKLATLGGLDTCCDMEIIFPYIKDTHSILEVGAGYGRVLDYLTKQNYQGKISAVERSLSFNKILQSKFKDKVSLYNKDLHDFYSDQKFDVILWLWSGIADFSQHEQPLILKKLSSFLTPNGFLVIDSTPPLRKPVNVIKAKGPEYIIRLGNEISHVYCISNEEITLYAKKIGFKKITHIKYNTLANRIRILHFLQKSDF